MPSRAARQGDRSNRSGSRPDAGSIRGQFGTEVTFNLVHGSDSPESAEREIGDLVPLGATRPLHSGAALHAATSVGRPLVADLMAKPSQSRLRLMTMPKRIILASRSPQRKALLKSMGLTFTAIPSNVEETSEGEPREVVLANALAKGQAVAARRREGTLVIAGDTEVVVDGRVVGQPAFGSGRRAGAWRHSRAGLHEVLGALALIGPDRVDGEPAVRTGVESCRVTFDELRPELIDRYLASEEWRERAGGYAVQGLGSALVRQTGSRATSPT